MEILSFPIFRHQVCRCPCGHGTHGARGIEKIIVFCYECDVIAKDAGAELTIISTSTAEAMSVGVGSLVRYDRRTMVVEHIEQVMLLDGRVPTAFVLVLLGKRDRDSGDEITPV